MKIKKYLYSLKNRLIWYCPYAESREILMDIYEYFLAGLSSGSTEEQIVSDFDSGNNFAREYLPKKRRGIALVRIIAVLSLFLSCLLIDINEVHQRIFLPTMIYVCCIVSYQFFWGDFCLNGVIRQTCNEIKKRRFLFVLTSMEIIFLQLHISLLLPKHYITQSGKIISEIIALNIIYSVVSCIIITYALCMYILRTELSMSSIIIQQLGVLITIMQFYIFLKGADDIIGYLTNFVSIPCIVGLIYAILEELFFVKRTGDYGHTIKKGNT